LRYNFFLFFHLDIVIKKVIIPFCFRLRFILLLAKLKISFSKSLLILPHCWVIKMFLSFFLDPINHIYNGCFKLIKLVTVDRRIWEVGNQHRQNFGANHISWKRVREDDVDCVNDGVDKWIASSLPCALQGRQHT